LDENFFPADHVSHGDASGFDADRTAIDEVRHRSLA
jgi:hypothetical protein